MTVVSSFRSIKTPHLAKYCAKSLQSFEINPARLNQAFPSLFWDILMPGCVCVQLLWLTKVLVIQPYSQLELLNEYRTEKLKIQAAYFRYVVMWRSSSLTLSKRALLEKHSYLFMAITISMRSPASKKQKRWTRMDCGVNKALAGHFIAVCAPLRGHRNKETTTTTFWARFAKGRRTGKAEQSESCWVDWDKRFMEFLFYFFGLLDTMNQFEQQAFSVPSLLSQYGAPPLDCGL